LTEERETGLKNQPKGKQKTYNFSCRRIKIAAFDGVEKKPTVKNVVIIKIIET
jgi:hypothetical protein